MFKLIAKRLDLTKNQEPSPNLWITPNFPQDLLCREMRFYSLRKCSPYLLCFALFSFAYFQVGIWVTKAVYLQSFRLFWFNWLIFHYFCVCQAPQNVWRSEDDLWKLVFSMIMWVLGIKPGTSALAKSAFICWSTWPILFFFFILKHILSINVYVYMKHKANI